MCCCLVAMSNSLWSHGLQHTRLLCPPLSPGICSNSCPLSRWCYLTISSSPVPFSCLQSFPESRSFPMSQLFASGGQSTGASASASVFPMNIEGWFPLGLTGLILQSMGPSRVFFSTTIWKHQFFGAYYSIIAYSVVSCNIILRFSLLSSLYWCQFYDLLKALMMVRSF